MANPNWVPNKLSKAEQKIKDAAKKQPKPAVKLPEKKGEDERK